MKREWIDKAHKSTVLLGIERAGQGSVEDPHERLVEHVDFSATTSSFTL